MSLFTAEQEAAYIEAAKSVLDAEMLTEELAVGWKISSVICTTRSGYRWQLVRAGDAPVAHQAPAWDASNTGECPSREGDGLCLIPCDGGRVRQASSGGLPLSRAIGHVLVYPSGCAHGSGKVRVPWCVQVDCFDPLEKLCTPEADLWRANLQGADLQGANLQGANLRGADLQRANLQGANLQGANLQRAYLWGAYLWGAYLQGANLQGADLWRANLRGANLQGACLQGANLQGADGPALPPGWRVDADGLVVSA